MVDILTPENDKKRLYVLSIILVIVAVLAVTYKITVLTQKGTPQENFVPVPATEDTSVVPQDAVAQPQFDGAIVVPPPSKLTPMPPPPTLEDLKKMSEEVAKKETMNTPPSSATPVTQ